MPRTTHDSYAHDLPDVREFVNLVGDRAALARHGAGDLFDPAVNIFVARAPGRLDVMGGIADYSGSLVLEMPTAEATLVAAQRVKSRDGATPDLRIVSLGADGSRATLFEMPLADFYRGGEIIGYDQARERFRRDPAQAWAAYAAGVLLVLMRERGARFDDAVRLLIASQVPEGKGVSSSAAIEVATLFAVCAAFGIECEARESALLCQQVENSVVGAPCGVMDQMTSACGAEGRLLALLCQPAELLGAIRLPDDLAVWGLDSGVRHSVGAGDYGSVRTGAFIGYRLIAEAAGLSVTPCGEGRVCVDDPRWRGYLANVTPSEYEERFAAELPERIAGDEFLEKYGGITDSVTRVDPSRAYAVREPAAHAIYEHGRVRLFAELLNAPAGERRNESLGELMYLSHLSYGRCGLGSDGTDLLVRLVREAGAEVGLYGAKITGGGSGGTIAVLGRADAGRAVARVAAEYRRRTEHDPHVFAGSSPGAAAFGFLEIGRTK